VVRWQLGGDRRIALGPAKKQTQRGINKPMRPASHSIEEAHPPQTLLRRTSSIFAEQMKAFMLHRQSKVISNMSRTAASTDFETDVIAAHAMQTVRTPG